MLKNEAKEKNEAAENIVTKSDSETTPLALNNNSTRTEEKQAIVNRSRKRPPTKDKLLGMLCSWSFLGVFLIAVFAVGIYFNSSYTVFEVSGNSMNPGLSNGDTIVIHKYDKLERDNIVVFRKPANWSKVSGGSPGGTSLIKRIIALPGDVVNYSHGFITVNGVKVDQLPSGYSCKPKANVLPIRVPEGKIYAAGDNDSDSVDGRSQMCRGATDFLLNQNQIILSGKLSYQM